MIKSDIVILFITLSITTLLSVATSVPNESYDPLLEYYFLRLLFLLAMLRRCFGEISEFRIIGLLIVSSDLVKSWSLSSRTILPGLWNYAIPRKYPSQYFSHSLKKSSSTFSCSNSADWNMSISWMVLPFLAMRESDLLRFSSVYMRYSFYIQATWGDI